MSNWRWRPRLSFLLKHTGQRGGRTNGLPSERSKQRAEDRGSRAETALTGRHCCWQAHPDPGCGQPAFCLSLHPPSRCLPDLLPTPSHATSTFYHCDVLSIALGSDGESRSVLSHTATSLSSDNDTESEPSILSVSIKPRLELGGQREEQQTERWRSEEQAFCSRPLHLQKRPL